MPAPSAQFSGNGADDLDEEPEMIVKAPAAEVALAPKLPAKRKTVKIAALSYPIV